MAKPRKIMQEVTYHTYSRCQGLNKFLLEKFAKKRFIEAIKMCQLKYSFQLIAAEIVDNHFHLIIRTLKDEATINLIMQYIKARTAEKYNRGTGRVGPFWNERYGCTIIEESDNPQAYLFRLIWYIAYNPVKKGLSRDPRENYIGFINCYLIENYELPIKITLHHYFYQLGDSFVECAKKLLQYEDDYLKRIGLYF
ncbi:MAG: transposase [Spirochaetes bacterium]|nr:transposase [Spirochaetota bacterium]